MAPVGALVTTIAKSSTLASLGTIAKTVGTIAGGIGAVSSLTSKLSTPSQPTLTAPTPAVADTPQTTTAQVSQARRDSQDRARAQASAQSASQQTNLTKGLTKVSDNEEDTPRARRKTFGV